MNLISAKALSELHLNGVSIDWVKEDIREMRQQRAALAAAKGSQP